jgi:hypothetical protein
VTGRARGLLRASSFAVRTLPRTLLDARLLHRCPAPLSRLLSPPWLPTLATAHALVRR